MMFGLRAEHIPVLMAVFIGGPIVFGVIFSAVSGQILKDVAASSGCLIKFWKSFRVSLWAYLVCYVLGVLGTFMGYLALHSKQNPYTKRISWRTEEDVRMLVTVCLVLLTPIILSSFVNRCIELSIDTEKNEKRLSRRINVFMQVYGLALGGAYFGASLLLKKL